MGKIFTGMLSFPERWMMCVTSDGTYFYQSTFYHSTQFKVFFLNPRFVLVHLIHASPLISLTTKDEVLITCYDRITDRLVIHYHDGIRDQYAQCVIISTANYIATIGNYSRCLAVNDKENVCILK